LFQSLDDRSKAERERLDGGGKGLGDLLVRTVEKAMKLSLVCQLAIDPMSESISKGAASYAIQYVEWCDQDLVTSAKNHIHDNNFMKTATKVTLYIKKHGEVTARQISRGVTLFANLKARERQEVLEVLLLDGAIIRTERQNASGRSYYVFSVGKEL